MFSNITKHFFPPLSLFFLYHSSTYWTITACFFTIPATIIIQELDFFCLCPLYFFSFPSYLLLAQKSTVPHVNLPLLLQWHSNHNLQCQETASHERAGRHTSQRNCANFFHSCLPVSGRAPSLKCLWNRHLLINRSFVHLQETLSASCR